MDLPVPITGLYAGLQAIIAFALTYRVGQLRGKEKVSIGDGGKPNLLLAIRQHGNWSEHVPFALLLMALLELNGAGAALLHGLGIALLVSRVAHPLGLKIETLSTPARIVGAGVTGLATMVAAVALIVKAF